MGKTKQKKTIHRSVIHTQIVAFYCNIIVVRLLLRGRERIVTARRQTQLLYRGRRVHYVRVYIGTVTRYFSLQAKRKKPLAANVIM